MIIPIADIEVCSRDFFGIMSEIFVGEFRGCVQCVAERPGASKVFDIYASAPHQYSYILKKGYRQ